MALLFFRGRDENGFPRGSVLDTRADATPQLAFGQPAAHSLELHGDRGVFARYHRAWWGQLLRRRVVSRRFFLPAHEIQALRFDRFVRLGNQLYLIKSLRVVVGPGATVLAEANLVSFLSD